MPEQDSLKELGVVVVRKAIPSKVPIQSNDALVVELHDAEVCVAPETKKKGEAPLDMPVYFFGDMLEELFFAGKQRDQFALLSGQRYVEVRQTEENRMYMEVTHFSNMFPTKSALDYAACLRCDQSLLNTTEKGEVLGFVAIHSRTKPVCMEEVMLFRSAFNLPGEVMLILDVDDQKMHCYRMTPSGQLEKTPFYVVNLREGDKDKVE